MSPTVRGLYDLSPHLVEYEVLVLAEEKRLEGEEDVDPRFPDVRLTTGPKERRILMFVLFK